MTETVFEKEVQRVYKILGPRIIVSASHEAVLPNVPLKNLFAIARATADL